MAKFKYFKWLRPDLGFGVGETILYIEAEDYNDAKNKLIDKRGFKHDPHFIAGDIKRVKEFIQPKPIPIIK